MKLFSLVGQELRTWLQQLKFHLYEWKGAPLKEVLCLLNAPLSGIFETRFCLWGAGATWRTCTLMKQTHVHSTCAGSTSLPWFAHEFNFIYNFFPFSLKVVLFIVIVCFFFFSQESEMGNFAASTMEMIIHSNFSHCSSSLCSVTLSLCIGLGVFWDFWNDIYLYKLRILSRYIETLVAIQV